VRLGKSIKPINKTVLRSSFTLLRVSKCRSATAYWLLTTLPPLFVSTKIRNKIVLRRFNILYLKSFVSTTTCIDRNWTANKVVEAGNVATDTQIPWYPRSVCLCVCRQDISKCYWRIWTKFCSMIDLWPRTNRLNYGINYSIFPAVRDRAFHALNTNWKS